MLKVGILRREDDPGSSGGPKVIPRVLIKGGGCVRVSEGDVMTEMSDSKREGLEDATLLALVTQKSSVSEEKGALRLVSNQS